MPTTAVFADSIGEAMRAVRHERQLSQRELAHDLGWSKSSVGRLESGGLPGGVKRLDEALGRVGLRLAVVARPVGPGPGATPDSIAPGLPEVRPRPGSGTPPGRAAQAAETSSGVGGGCDGGDGVTAPDLRRLAAPGELGPTETRIVACWRERVDAELVRDALGRRPPAHRHVYPRRVPHWWWVRRHPHTPWVDRPTWSWSRVITSAAEVRRLGVYPRPVGLPPRGGAPMQGYPPYVRPEHHLPMWMERRWEAQETGPPRPSGG